MPVVLAPVDEHPPAALFLRHGHGDPLRVARLQHLPDASANAFVVSASTDGRIPTERWSPFDPDVFATACRPSWSSRSCSSSATRAQSTESPPGSGIEVEHDRRWASTALPARAWGVCSSSAARLAVHTRPGTSVERARRDVGVGVERARSRPTPVGGPGSASRRTARRRRRRASRTIVTGSVVRDGGASPARSGRSKSITWPLVKPVAGYSTLSRLVRRRRRPATSTARFADSLSRVLLEGGATTCEGSRPTARASRTGRPVVPQAIWTGSISFGLVTVPVRLVSATRSQDVRFHQLEAEHRQPHPATGGCRSRPGKRSPTTRS